MVPTHLLLAILAALAAPHAVAIAEPPRTGEARLWTVQDAGGTITWDVQPADTYEAMNLRGQVMAAGREIGRIDLDRGHGSGRIVWPQGDGRSVALVLRAVPRAGSDAVEVILTPASGRAEDDMAGRLLLARDAAGQMTGTLITEVGVTEVSVLAEAPPDETHDLPGFGIWKSAYRLRGVPSGQGLTLRLGPSRDAVAVSRINAAASGIFITGCTPEVDQIAFEQASRDRKLATLDALWCMIEVPMAGDAIVSGWVPGRYLEPAP